MYLAPFSDVHGQMHRIKPPAPRQRGACFLLLTLVALVSPPAFARDDPWLWLEDVLGKRALAWVDAQNEASTARLQADPRFQLIEQAALAVYAAKDRIAYVRQAGDRVMNFWQDETHVRGILRTASLSSWLAGAPDWDTLLDVDALARAEGENWVYKGSDCLAPAYRHCMVMLSRGGADAVVLREFDMQTGDFVAGGFSSDEAKQSVDWIDQDHLLIGKAGDGFAVTHSGYPAELRVWKRGTTLANSQVVFAVPESHVSAYPAVLRSKEATHVFAIDSPAFFREEITWLGDLLSARAARPKTLPLPPDIDWRGMFGDQVIALTRAPWDAGGKVQPAGALIAAPFSELLEGDISGVRTLVAPGERGAIHDVGVSQSSIHVGVMDNVRMRLLRLQRTASGWRTATVPLPETGSLGIVSANRYSDLVLVNFEEFLVPDSLYAIDGTSAPKLVAQLPKRFAAEALVASQTFATSKDGVRVPSFLVHKRGAKGPMPTLLYGYGGFEVSLTPAYLGPLAVAWLETGGAYAIANIRGGGEFGPAWHQAALKSNRQRAFDDFAAVAEHLIETGVTEASRLGIYGGSNGGLLVGAALTQRPELYGAVVAAVPLLDMLRYHKLLAGASWMGEYGNPDLPEERAWLAAWSPYQNLAEGAEYPPVFLTTSTRDDRVHPGHARKMAAKMLAQGHEVVYFENTEGGHSAAANLAQSARRDALVATFLMQELMPDASASSSEN